MESVVPSGIVVVKSLEPGVDVLVESAAVTVVDEAALVVTVVVGTTTPGEVVGIVTVSAEGAGGMLAGIEEVIKEAGLGVT